MKTAFATLAVLFAAEITFAQSPTTEARPDRLNTSLRELKRYEFRPMPVTIIDKDGVRVYNNQAEADRKEKERSEKQIALNKQIEQSNKIWQHQAEQKANDAVWKLCAFGIGIFIGFLRILWSIATSK